MTVMVMPTQKEQERSVDPIIEMYKMDIDRTLLRENLKLTPEQRLQKLQNFMSFLEEIRRGGRKHREKKFY